MSDVDQAARQAAEAIIYDVMENPKSRNVEKAIDIIAAEFKGLAEERDQLLEERRDSLSRWHNISESEAEVKRLRAMLERARKCMNLGCSDVQLLADIDAALALGENNG